MARHHKCMVRDGGPLPSPVRNCGTYIACAIALVVCASVATAQMRTFDTQHYRIHTDLDQQLAADLAMRMDAMYAEYVRRMEDFRVPRDHPPFEVYLFRRQADYMNFTDHRFPNTGGVFMPGRNLLAAYLEGQGRDSLRRTLQHEAFHQFAHLAISPRMPVWLNEGLAQLFEEGIWTGDGFSIGQVPPRRVRQLHADIQARRLIEFDKLLSMSHQEWSANLTADAVAGATQYNQTWAMVHFLVYAQDRRGAYPYRDALLEMLKLIHQGNDGEAAFKRAFGAADFAGFERLFAEYTRQLEPTAEAMLMEHQDIQADLLKHLVAAGQGFRDFVEFRDYIITRRYRMNYTRGNVSWRTEEDPSIYFSDADGRLLRSDAIFFEPRAGAAIPDIVRIVNPRVQLRTRFHQSGAGVIDHEVLIEQR